MGFVGNYAPYGLPPQIHDMPVIQKKRGAGYPALAPGVLWLEILQTLRFYREGSLWHKRSCCV